MSANFTENVLQNQMDTPKSTQGMFDLPCGYIDPSGVLHTEFHVREMTGREEDLLASNKISAVKKINQLLGSCLLRLGTIVDRNQLMGLIPNLVQGDRVFMLLALRRTTLGDEYPVEETCPSCGVKNFYMLSLGDLETKPLEDRMKRVFDVALPSGLTARIRMATGVEEEKVSKVNDEEKPSVMLLARTDLLDGKPPSLMAIKNLGWKDRQALRQAMEDNDGGVDSNLDLSCPACGHEFSRDLDLGSQGFFFPHRVQKDSKAKSST